MSRTPNIGVVGVKHWSCMAAIMAACLEEISNGREIVIPAGVLRDAQLFFNIVLERETGTHFDNPPARIRAHTLAWEILNDCPVLQAHTLKEANGRFHRFAKFLKKLEKQPLARFDKGWARQPSPSWARKNKKTAEDLRDFFAALLRKDAREGRC
jgi:hypothetical protein